MSHPDVTLPEAPNPIYYWLIDDVKRGKLRDISNALKERNLADVRFGIEGPTFLEIKEMVGIIDDTIK